uniref:Uncharacterized protein n=1 Tax=Desertifilum tharense IPPAS B-1220 TaxID=1781255 RepID=A0ACD5GXN7_9CYAN
MRLVQDVSRTIANLPSFSLTPHLHSAHRYAEAKATALSPQHSVTHSAHRYAEAKATALYTQHS